VRRYLQRSELRIDTTGDDYHDRAVLPDGRVGYLHVDADGRERISAEARAVDYGGNVWAARRCPASLLGLLSELPPGLPGRIVYTDDLAVRLGVTDRFQLLDPGAPSRRY
jgi:hypothetical protein